MQVVYVGDGNNITHSWIRLAAKFNFELVCACPEGFEPDQPTVDLVNNGGAGKVTISHDVYDVSRFGCPPPGGWVCGDFGHSWMWRMHVFD